MVRRADSIWRLSTQAASSACRPNSPKATVLPRCALPPRLPRCTLRCLKRLGINMVELPLSPVVGGARRALTAGGARRFGQAFVVVGARPLRRIGLLRLLVAGAFGLRGRR